MFNRQNKSKNAGNLDTKFFIIILVCKKTSQFWTMYFYKKYKKNFLLDKKKWCLIVEFMTFICKYFFFDFAGICIDWMKKIKIASSTFKKCTCVSSTVLNFIIKGLLHCYKIIMRYILGFLLHFWMDESVWNLYWLNYAFIIYSYVIFFF